MNLKKTVFSAVAAGAILLTSFAGVSAQTTTGTVIVTGDGVFDPQFCDVLNLGTKSVTSATGAVATGTVTVCVVDDVAYREVQNISMSASDFEATNPAINAKIPAANLKIVKTYNPVQARWSSGVCGAVLPDGSNRPCVGDAAGLANSGSDRVTSGSITWTTPGPLNGTGQPILHFWNGSGTSSVDGAVGTLAAMDVELTIPAAQRPATYENVLTLDVTPGHP